VYVGKLPKSTEDRSNDGSPVWDALSFIGPEDQASAMAMITEAAVAYDKTSPASFSLGAFEGATMTPLVFKEQLRR